MFSALEHMYTALELMFKDREHNFSSYNETFEP